MAHVAVIGAGPAGLATSLFLARRGHQVSLVEKDADAPPSDPEAVFQTWSRRGVAQARQPHIMMARASMVLQAEAPDVLDAMVAAGANLLTNKMEMVGPYETEQPFTLCARRLVFEAVLREKVLAEKTVRWYGGVEVSGLIVDRKSEIPGVRGLSFNGGEILADLVVDASGRYSKTPSWFDDQRLGTPEEALQDCGFCYISRWYRLKPGETLTKTAHPVVVNSPFIRFSGLAADADVFCLIAISSLKDPLTPSVRHAEIFERIMTTIPVLSDWLAKSEPISEMHVLARIENRSRSLVREGAPLVSGFVLLGDSALHTNPTLGRGVSMAYVQAQRLAAAVSETDPSTPDFVVNFENWRERELGVWYQTQVQADRAWLASLDAALAGKTSPPPQEPAARFMAVLPAVAAQNPQVARAFLRMVHLLIKPAELVGDPAVQAAVTDYLAKGGGPLPLTGPSRSEFERLVAG